MVTKVTFNVQMSPIPHIGKIMRQADLCDGVAIIQQITVIWKEGEVVDEQRIDKAKANLKKALESRGYDIYSLIQEKGKK